MSVSAVTVTNIGGYLVQVETLQGPGGTQTVQSVLGPASGRSGSGQSDADGDATASAVLGADQSSLPDTVSQLRQNAQSQDTAVPWLQGQPTHRGGPHRHLHAHGANASGQGPMSAFAQALQPYGASTGDAQTAALPWQGSAPNAEASQAPQRRHGPHRPPVSAHGTRPFGAPSGHASPLAPQTATTQPLAPQASGATQPSWLTRNVRTDGTI